MPDFGRAGRHRPQQVRVGSLTGLVTGPLEEWSSRGGNALDKIRLIDPPHIFTQYDFQYSENKM